jgi:hypothetical protein
VKGRALLAIGCLSLSVFAAQTPEHPQTSPQSDTTIPQNTDPNSQAANDSDGAAFIVYLSQDPKPIPLERQTVILRNGTGGAGGGIYITVPNQRSSLRVTASPVFIVEGNGVGDASHPVKISPLKVVGGARELPVAAVGFSKIDTRHHIAGKDAVEVNPVNALDPGEYMITVQKSDEIRDGDSVFLFGVD